MRSIRTTLVGLLMWVSAVGVAQAEHTFEFGLGGSSPVTDFTIGAVGDTVDLEVYLREFGSPGDILATELLFSSAVGLSFDSGIAAVQDVTDITASPAFDDILLSVSTGEATLNEAAFLNPFVFPDAENRILLGTFRFTALGAGSTTITVSDLTPTLDETITGDFTVLDADISDGSATLTVVPEPTLLALWGGLAMCGGVALWRRRNRRQP